MLVSHSYPFVSLIEHWSFTRISGIITGSRCVQGGGQSLIWGRSWQRPTDMRHQIPGSEPGWETWTHISQVRLITWWPQLTAWTQSLIPKVKFSNPSRLKDERSVRMIDTQHHLNRSLLGILIWAWKKEGLNGHTEIVTLTLHPFTYATIHSWPTPTKLSLMYLRQRVRPPPILI